MTDNVLCPYCGSEMEVVSGYRMGSLAWVACARCTQKGCDALGPRVDGFDTSADAEAAALSAAQARYLPPNRPLTLDEVNALPADDDGYTPCFLEIEPNWYAQDTDDFEPRLRADAICKEALGCETCNKGCETYNKGCETCNKGCETYNKGCETCNKGCETYNKIYRVWLRKPTQAEMDAAGWGDAE